MHRWHTTRTSRSTAGVSTSTQSHLQALLISVLVAGLALPAAHAAQPSTPVVVSAQPPYGTIVGIVTNAAKLPVARATVTAVRVDGSGTRATLSGSDGVYSFADLPSGTWSVTAQIEGAPDAAASQLDVVASKATRYDIVMNAPGSDVNPATVAATPPPAHAVTTMTHSADSIFDGILARLNQPPGK